MSGRTDPGRGDPRQSVGGAPPSFPAGAAQELRERILGTVILPSDAAYTAARQGPVTNSPDLPQIIVAGQGIGDVQEALAFARRHGLWVVCRSGGHSTAGYSTGSGMVIDLAGLDDVRIDPGGLRAVVGAGCRLGKLNAALDGHGLHVPGGGCPDVAVAGHAMGGGYGITSLLFGLHCDSVTSALVVLADGRLVRADESTNADLLWALRGGTGNNFGIVVQLTYRLHRLGALWGFGVSFDLDDALAAVQVMQRDLTGPSAPAGLGHESLLVHVGREPRLLLRGVFDGGREQGRSALGTILSLPGAAVDIDRMGSYTSLNTELLSTLPNAPRSAPFVADSRFVADLLSADEWSSIIDHHRATPDDGNFIAIEPGGGAIAEVPVAATAYVHRRVSMDVLAWAYWHEDAGRGPAGEWLDGLVAILDPLGNGEACQNYPRRTNTDFARMYWGESYPALQTVKAAYDPENVFRYEQGVTAPVISTAAPGPS